MPIPRKGQTVEQPGVPATGGLPRKSTAAPREEWVPPVDAAEDDDSMLGTAGAAVGGTALLGGAAALAAKAKNAPGLLGMLGKGANVVNAARQQLMLSGFALPKSVLGNVGAAVEAGIENRSMAPLKALLSRQTVKDAVRSYKTHSGAMNNPAGVGQVNLPGPMPGRIMGALDEATQGALVRSGTKTASEAQNATLQSPLGENFGKMGEALEGPVARYMHPFRRTPFNQFIEGHKKIANAWKGGPNANRAAMGIYAGTGAVHGAATSDDNLPMSIPMATAASARYGVPYAYAAILGRTLAGGKGDGGAASQAIPVSEYGVSQGLTDPLKSFEPAALRALKKLRGE